MTLYTLIKCERLFTGHATHTRLSPNYVQNYLSRAVAIRLFRSRLLSRSTKIILYKTPIRPVVSYGAEVWTLTKKEEQAVLIFERKIFRRIYGPKYENGGMEKSDESRTRRDEQRRKYSKMDKRAKDKLVRLPRENGGGQDAQKDLH